MKRVALSKLHLTPVHFLCLFWWTGVTIVICMGTKRPADHNLDPPHLFVCYCTLPFHLILHLTVHTSLRHNPAVGFVHTTPNETYWRPYGPAESTSSTLCKPSLQFLWSCPGWIDWLITPHDHLLSEAFRTAARKGTCCLLMLNSAVLVPPSHHYIIIMSPH